MPKDGQRLALTCARRSRSQPAEPMTIGNMRYNGRAVAVRVVLDLPRRGGGELSGLVRDEGSQVAISDKHYRTLRAGLEAKFGEGGNHAPTGTSACARDF
jgi:hypothetical protein